MAYKHNEQRAYVKTEPAELRHLTRTVRATAAIQASERNLHWIAPRFDGWERQLYVNSTGQQVAKGQQLLSVYSHELQSTSREYQLALKSGMDDLAQSALQRLRNWEVLAESASQVLQPGNDVAFPHQRSGTEKKCGCRYPAFPTPGRCRSKPASTSSQPVSTRRSASRFSGATWWNWSDCAAD